MRGLVVVWSRSSRSPWAAVSTDVASTRARGGCAVSQRRMIWVPTATFSRRRNIGWKRLEEHYSLPLFEWSSCAGNGNRARIRRNPRFHRPLTATQDSDAFTPAGRNIDHLERGDIVALGLRIGVVDEINLKMAWFANIPRNLPFP
jgi:hypothetical protein